MDVVLAFSGGLDSTVLLAKYLAAGKKVLCVSAKYGSQHNERELACSKIVSDYYNTLYPGCVERKVIDLTPVFSGMQCVFLMPGAEIPTGKYSNDNIGQTAVPARNLVFASVLTSIASSLGAPRVALAIHQNDSVVYHDCSLDFATLMNMTIMAATGSLVSLDTPFVTWDKSEIVGLGHTWEVPFHLTRTCYTSKEHACGKCASCIDRLEAFAKLGLKDPIQYE